MSSRVLVALLPAALVLAAAGCGSSGGNQSSSSSGGAANPNAPETSPAGDIPDNQAYVRYSPPGATYSVKVPEGWSRTASGGSVRFTDKLNAIAMTSRAASAAPTVASTKGHDMPRLAGSVKGYTAGSVSSVSRKSGTAIRATYLATAKPNAVTGKAGTDAVERYAFFRKGREVVLTLTGPKGADNVDPWRIVTDSLRWR